MRSFPSVPVFTVEVATGLLVMRESEYLVEPLQELSFTGIWSTVDEYAIRLVVGIRE